MDEEERNDGSADNREEETRDEIRDNDYVNDDEVEMLRSIEERFNGLDAKLDMISDAISLFVQNGATITEIDDSEDESDYEDDFIDIDDLDLTL